jgi:hypothetical protein
MTDSILNTIKQMLGLLSDDTAFDTDIIVNINSVFMTLHQLGVGTATVFSISDATALWATFLTDPEMYSAVKTYMFLKVRLLFDPPSSSYHLSAIERQIAEFEWRLVVQVPIHQIQLFQRRYNVSELKHVGILGMKWGHRKTRDASTHQGRSNILSDQIKAKKRARIDDFFKKEDAAIASMKLKVETMKNKKMDEIDNSKSGEVVKWIKRGVWKDHFNTVEQNMFFKVGDSLAKSERKIERDASLAKKKAESDLYKKIHEEAKKKRAEFYKLPFPQGLVSNMKYNREIEEKMVEDLLKIELKYTT